MYPDTLYFITLLPIFLPREELKAYTTFTTHTTFVHVYLEF